jgi:arylsulfatase A-like enzyme
MKRKPNFIFFLADDLGYGDLGCYGAPDIKSPYLDQMANEGALFTNAYAAAPVCSPTRVAFVTGRYQQRIGQFAEEYMKETVGTVEGSPGLEPDKHPTVGMYLKEAGYNTAIIGKWNVGGGKDIPPTVHGFDYWLGYHHNMNYFTHSQTWYKKGVFQEGPPMLYENGHLVQMEGYLDDIVTDKTIRFIEENAGQEKPFFLYIPWQIPHDPLQSPFGDPKVLPNYGDRSDYKKARSTYIEMVQRMDDNTGLIMDVLKKLGIDEETVVFFASDNGGHPISRNLPLKGYKQDLDEGGIRVPFIIRWPGVVPPGQISSQLSITMDITATIAALAEAKVPEEHRMDGINLIPYLTGQKQVDENRTLYWRRRTINYETKVNKVRAKAIREGNWKYIRDYARKFEALYNLEEDLAETNNAIQDQPDIAMKLKEKLEAWEEEVQNNI